MKWVKERKKKGRDIGRKEKGTFEGKEERKIVRRTNERGKEIMKLRGEEVRNDKHTKN